MTQKFIQTFPFEKNGCRLQETTLTDLGETTFYGATINAYSK